MTTLELHDVVVTHGARRLVDVPHLALEPGRPVTIVGESGSGKSLLAHALMGTLASSLEVDGKLALDGTLLHLGDRSNRRALWGREIAMLPQEPALALDPTMRVLPQVAEGALRATRATARRRAEAALADLGLAGSARSFPHTLSGGMAQRVAYAAATIGGARVLIVDEPSKGLDSGSVDRLAGLLRDHAGDGGLLLTITHDLRLAAALGGEVVVMREAAIVESGEAAVVLGSPSTTTPGGSSTPTRPAGGVLGSAADGTRRARRSSGRSASPRPTVRTASSPTSTCRSGRGSGWR